MVFMNSNSKSQDGAEPAERQRSIAEPRGSRFSSAIHGCIVLLCGDDYRRFLPARLQQPAAAAQQCALLWLGRGGAGGGVSCLHAVQAERCDAADLWTRFVRILKRGFDRPIHLAELGRVAGLSPFTVQRLFKKELGVSPLQYQRALRAGRLRNELRQGGSVTNAIYEAGFGSSSRAYEGSALGMTPARFAQGGRGEQISFTTARTRFGWLVVGATARGLCWLALGATSAEAEASLRDEFPLATLQARCCIGNDGGCGAGRGCAARALRRRLPHRRCRSICAGRHFSFACGRLCGPFLAARRAAIASWRVRWANPRPRGRWLGPAL